jgi:serine/threonine-protein kinase
MGDGDRDSFALCGTTIDGKYRVVEVVGEGGFGVVYKGVHEGFDAPVAIKCLKLPAHFDVKAQDALVRQLREEGRTLLRLSQRTPGILQALDVGSFTTPSGARVPYLILEWLEGRTLADELKARQTFSLREAFARLDPAARALAVAHEEKVAHRDIKPENLFCIESGGKPTIKILDFGIAKLLGEAATPTSGTAMGTLSMFTPSYGAPEQFDKSRGASGPWTDVFAFALVFVELVTGRPALEGDGLFALFNAASDPVSRPTLSSRGVAAPEAVEKVLRKAVEPNPAARYPDIGAFWGALEAAMQGLPDVSLPVPVFPSRPTDLGSADTMQLGQVSPVALPIVTAPATQIDVPPENAAAGNAGSVHTTARSAGAPSRRGPVVGIVGTLVLAAVASGAFLFLRARPHPSEPVATSASSSSSATPPGADGAAPPVVATGPGAAAYRDGLQAWHDGATEAAIRDLEQAVSLDRELGAAQLRLALWHFALAGAPAGKQVEGREHYQAALLHRASMSEVDRSLLAAAEPYMRQPWDLHDWTKRLEDLTKKYPTNAELHYYLGEAHQLRLAPDAAITAYDRALALDPTFVIAHVAEAESLAMKGDVEGQLRAYRTCLETSPQATQCLMKQLTLRAQVGRCGAMKTDAQRLLSIDPKSPDAHRELALSLSATGSSSDSVLEAFARSWALEPSSERKVSELQDRTSLAELTGDFVGAEPSLADWLAAVADKPNQSAHIAPAQRLAELYTEIGLPKKASDAADSFLRKMNAWTEQATGDPTLLFLSYRLRAGAITRDEYDKARTDALERFRNKWTGAGRKLDDDFAWLSWSMAYGTEVVTADEARAAVDAMPKTASKAAESGRWPAIDLAAGKTYALVGQYEHALTPLKRIGSPCLALVDPVNRIGADFYLGMALEGTGDADGARTSYRRVLERWGKAKPRSVTGEQAKKRLHALAEKKK